MESISPDLQAVRVYALVKSYYDRRPVFLRVRHPIRTRDQFFLLTETNWLMLFGEIVAVCCENHTEHTDTVCTSTLRFRYRHQPFNAVWGNSHCLLKESFSPELSVFSSAVEKRKN
jgi:hypothetical protein